MFRFNVDRFYDDNPQDAVGGTNAPSVARRYSRRSWTAQAQSHGGDQRRSSSTRRAFAYLHGDPVTLWEAQTSRPPTRAAGTVPFTIGQSRASDLFGHQFQFSDTLSWSRGKHYAPLRRQRAPSHLGRHGQRARHRDPRHVHVQRPTTTAPFDQLTLADVQNYTQPINFGISSYELPQWLYTGFVQDSIHAAAGPHRRPRAALRPADA